MSDPVVVALDLSLTSTGVARAGRGKVALRRVRSNGKAAASLERRAARIDGLVDEIAAWCGYPALVVVEGPSLGQARQAGQHDRAGLWWATVMAMRAVDAEVVEVPPATLKKYATGRGNASKDEVLAAVVRRYPAIEVDGNDTADALVLLAMALHHYQISTLPTVPQSHAAALDKVRWPELKADR
jgi:Holliday junction resolvasome RuvABC endonuclease subunit